MISVLPTVVLPKKDTPTEEEVVLSTSHQCSFS